MQDDVESGTKLPRHEGIEDVVLTGPDAEFFQISLEGNLTQRGGQLYSLETAALLNATAKREYFASVG